MKKILLALLVCLAATSETFAADPTVMIVNATRTNINFLYAIRNADGTSTMGGKFNIFTHKLNYVKVDLLTNGIHFKTTDGEPSLHINTADEIDEQGNILFNGAHGAYNEPNCTAKDGQAIFLWRSKLSEITCSVLG